MAKCLREMANDIERGNVFIHDFNLDNLKFEEKSLNINFVEYKKEELDNE